MKLEYLIPLAWRKPLQKEFQKEYFKNLSSFLQEESTKYNIFPPEKEIFSAFQAVKPQNVRVIILGQDPYHNKDQAHGFSFSVKKDIKIPASLRNIHKELENDLGIAPPQHGNLENWAKQGVFLLNTCLTVRESEAGSHQNKGWEQFTDEVIRYLSSERKGLVFMLWGKHAQKKSCLIDTTKHHVLESNHPSPLSAYRGFFGCRHFSKANEIIVHNGGEAISWKLH